MQLTIKSHSYNIPIKPYLKELYQSQFDLLPIANGKYDEVKRHYEIWIRYGQHTFPEDLKTGKYKGCNQSVTVDQMSKSIRVQLKNKKDALTYYEDAVRFQVCLRQQKLKKAIKYHKLCETYERYLMDLICEGKARQLEITNLETKTNTIITGESEQARKGCDQMMQFFNKRQRTLDSLLRANWFK